MERIRYIGEIVKQVAERRSLTVDFTGRMPTGATLSSCAVSAKILPAGTTDNTVISGTTATISGATATVYALGGVDSFRYRITFTATLSDTSVLVEDILMLVDNIG